MYNQLASWMVYGTLQDQYGEFFIRRYAKRNSFLMCGMNFMVNFVPLVESSLCCSSFSYKKLCSVDDWISVLGMGCLFLKYIG